MKRLLLVSLLSLPMAAFAQKFHLKDNGMPIDKKAAAALRYDYEVTTVDNAEYVFEVFFKAKSGTFGKYSAFYKLYSKDNKELYKSEEWTSQKYGGQAENYFVKQMIEKDLPKALKKIQN